MCLIAIKSSGVALPKEKYLLHAETRNSDGIGIMYWRPNTADVFIKKDFINAQGMINWVKDNIKLEDTLVIHFRLATHGLKDIGNRHPFPITKNTELLRKPEVVCQVAVAHNGVISEYGHHAKFSDTQKFVLDILADEGVKNNLDSEAVQKLISAFIDGDKLVILRNDGVCYRFGEWITDDGIFYSNDGYKPHTWLNNLNSFRNWQEDREDYNSYQDYNNRLQLNSSIGKTKGTSWVSMCDGCYQTKHVKCVEVGENVFTLCKRCRKLQNKGKLNVGGNGIDIESENMCDSCGEFVSEKELTEIPLEGGMKICKICHMSYIENGNTLNYME